MTMNEVLEEVSSVTSIEKKRISAPDAHPHTGEDLLHFQFVNSRIIIVATGQRGKK